MRSLTRQRLGIVLIVLAIVGLVGSFAVSAATAPDGGVASPNNSTDRGRTLVGMQAQGTIVMYDGSGNVLWRFGNGSASYFDVSMLDNGTVLAAFVAEDKHRCGPFEPPCARTGFRLIDPQPKPHIVGEWTFPVRSKLNSEVHDVNRLPNGSYLMTDMEYERIMIVAPNGTITWQWNASQRYDEPADPTTVDWLHINDVDKIGKDRYMVSVRNANQILFIERGKGVVEVINEDTPGSSDKNCRQHGNQLADYDNDSNGDILCGNPELLDHQHNPQYLGPGAVLVADSDNDRVVELHKKNGEWVVAWAVDSANGVGFNWPRDADRLPNGNTLITDSRNNRVVEVTPNGTTVWSVHTGIWPYDADRLPYGELIGGKRIDSLNGTGATAVAAGSTIPLLGRAYAGLSYVVALPLWFQPWHIGVAAAAVILTIVGIGLVWSGRRNR